MQSNNYLVCICGPTAVGKTDIAIQLAKYFSTEIISADSRQVYKEMNIGTSKPDKFQLTQVKHHLINTRSIKENYTVSDYEKDALKIIDTFFNKRNFTNTSHRLPITDQPLLFLCGGSGLFINAICEGLDEMPSSDPEIRNWINQKLQSIDGKKEIFNLLKEKDPASYRLLDLQNNRRVCRALEVCMHSGKPFSEFKKGKRKVRDFKVLKIGIEIERDKLYKKIDERVETMIRRGLFEEAEKLYVVRDFNALQTVGYSEIFNFIEGKLDRDECIRLIKRNTRHYAKRQMTWFNKDKEIRWFSEGKYKEMIEFIEKETT